eukprot:m.80813 g.80813  ORF g.80813 m.80813 type:complete len:386 (-) comp12617_c0_seq1:1107-2264(-)
MGVIVANTPPVALGSCHLTVRQVEEPTSSSSSTQHVPEPMHQTQPAATQQMRSKPQGQQPNTHSRQLQSDRPLEKQDLGTAARRDLDRILVITDNTASTAFTQQQRLDQQQRVIDEQKRQLDRRALHSDNRPQPSHATRAAVSLAGALSELDDDTELTSDAQAIPLTDDVALDDQVDEAALPRLPTPIKLSLDQTALADKIASKTEGVTRVAKKLQAERERAVELKAKAETLRKTLAENQHVLQLHMDDDNLSELTTDELTASYLKHGELYASVMNRKRILQSQLADLQNQLIQGKDAEKRLMLLQQKHRLDSEATHALQGQLERALRYRDLWRQQHEVCECDVMGCIVFGSRFARPFCAWFGFLHICLCVPCVRVGHRSTPRTG